MPQRFVPVTDPRPVDRAWRRLVWPLPPDVVLRGQVVELRPAEPDQDAVQLCAALDHDAAWEHVAGRPADPTGYADLLRTRIGNGWLAWIVRLRESYRGHDAGTIVGTTNYLDISPADARLEIGGTTYAPSVWATHVNPDTKLTLLRYAFDELGAGRVQLKTDIRNARSQQAIARLGASYEGNLRRFTRRKDDTIRDSVLFSIIAEEWPDVRAGLEERLTGVSGTR
jgi:RimJ/RimL family protein N-acetyltransferase